MSFTSLAEENAALKALLAQSQSALAEYQGALAASEEARRRLESIVDDLRRDKFGAKSEKLTPDQYNLPLEDIEIARRVLDAAQVLCGCGAGIVYSVAMGNALKWFPDRRGLAAGLTAAAFGAGSAAGEGASERAAASSAAAGQAANVNNATVVLN